MSGPIRGRRLITSGFLRGVTAVLADLRGVAGFFAEAFLRAPALVVVAAGAFVFAAAPFAVTVALPVDTVFLAERTLVALAESLVAEARPARVAFAAFFVVAVFGVLVALVVFLAAFFGPEVLPLVRALAVVPPVVFRVVFLTVLPAAFPRVVADLRVVVFPEEDAFPRAAVFFLLAPLDFDAVPDLDAAFDLDAVLDLDTDRDLVVFDLVDFLRDDDFDAVVPFDFVLPVFPRPEVPDAFPLTLDEREVFFLERFAALTKCGLPEASGMPAGTDL